MQGNDYRLCLDEVTNGIYIDSRLESKRRADFFRVDVCLEICKSTEVSFENGRNHSFTSSVISDLQEIETGRQRVIYDLETNTIKVWYKTDSIIACYVVLFTDFLKLNESCISGFRLYCDCSSMLCSKML
jgi:hypothetical protein